MVNHTIPRSLIIGENGPDQSISTNMVDPNTINSPAVALTVTATA